VSPIYVIATPTQIPISESYASLIPISLYGASKLASQALISEYCHMFNISGNAVRLANVVGPLSTHGVIYDFITKIQSNPSYLEIRGDGKQNKSYLYFDDCIDALILFLSTENKVGFELFNSGSNDAITVLETAKIVIKDLALDDIDIIYQRIF
jgi:UDP-glucose 4-epimerase